MGANNKGQALIELILAIAIVTILLVTLITGIITAREGFSRSGRNLEARNLLQKEIEALRSVRETDWNSIATPDTYHIEQSGNSWVVATETTIEGDFTRGFTVANVCRQDVTSTTIDCGDSAAILDPSTKEVTATVSWLFLGTKSISSTFYLTRYSGNQTWVQTTKADFNSGTHNNTKTVNRGGGAIELIISGDSSNFTDDYITDTDYTFDSNKVEVAGGYAQLKAQGSTISGETLNSGFNSDTSNWTFAPWGNNISQTGSYVSSGGNPGGYASINMPAARKKNSGGYWYQPFTTTVNDPVSTLSFDWRIASYDPDPKSFRVYAFVDTGSGTPNTGQSVYDSGEITSTTTWGTSGNIDVSAKITGAGTYYLKVAVYVQYQKNSTKGPYVVGFDNVLLSWSKTTGSYPTDSPTIYRNLSFSAPSISSWNSFSETSEVNGGSIRYQLSDDNGATWKYFNGSSWVNVASSTDYNDATTIDSNIGSFPTASSQINVRAFLISNGTQFVRLDQIIIGYAGASTGTYTSSTFDAGAEVSFNKIFWTENQTPNTTIRFQTATNNDNTTWNFVGFDGTANTFFTNSSGTIPLGSVSAKYIKFKIYFTSTTTDKPGINDVTINYSP